MITRKQQLDLHPSKPLIYSHSQTTHRDAVTCLVFREGSHQLYSGSLDRTVKLWSLDDRAYMDTLFGHQAEVCFVLLLHLVTVALQWDAWILHSALPSNESMKHA